MAKTKVEGQAQDQEASQEPKSPEVAQEPKAPEVGDVAKTSKVLIVAPCPIKIGDKYPTQDSVIEVSDDELSSQAWKHLFVTGRVVFEDDTKRTREYIQSIKRKPIQQPVETDPEK